ncbi:MAG: hypothetical protein HOW97_31180 [Catenulispora sp.]|nr:hypothetical protein [Catenulispora sp.]
MPEHPPIAPSHDPAPSTTSPSDYQVASAPQHGAPSADHLTGPDAALGHVPQADLSPDADQWAAGPAVHVDAAPAAGQWTHGPEVPRAGASMDPAVSGLDGHVPRADAGMDVGAAPAGAWTAADDQVLTGPDAFTPAHSAATAAVFERVGELAAEAYQPPPGVADPLHTDGLIPGTLPSPSGSFPGDPSQPADVPQTTATTTDLQHEDGHQSRHTIGERYYE